MTKAQTTERQEAMERLREWIKPGDTVYTILDHVSRSGMSRNIRVVLLKTNPETGEVVTLHPNHAVGLAIGARQAKHGDGLVIGGCGMDMGFHVVNSLSMALYPEYACLGTREDGRPGCPSNYHANHRCTVRCEGAAGRFCWRPDRFSARFPVPENWPTDARGGPLACLTGSDDNGQTPEVCPTCKGVGSLPNPDGPERWDLTHHDGYALSHKWL
jgi:hypothetical protein